MKKWFEVENNTNDSSIVVSTRVRLARNLSDIPFPDRMSLEEKNNVIKKVEGALKNAKFGKNITLNKINMDSLDEISANALAERRVISPEFAKNRSGRALFISDDEGVSVLVNEEDHIRIQVISSGSDLPICLKLATEIDSFLDNKLNFAFDETLGYLTQCPTNLGTGLRASVMLHLPMIESRRMIENLSNTVSKLGMTVRGSMGEGTNAEGSLYQISNQVTLGISEQNAIDNLMSIVNQVINQEKNLREQAFKNNEVETKDKIFRAYGLLSNARLISGDELLKLLSLIRLGASIGVLEIDFSILNALLFETGAYQICKNNNDALNTKIRDELRANTVREKLA